MTGRPQRLALVAVFALAGCGGAEIGEKAQQSVPHRLQQTSARSTGSRTPVDPTIAPAVVNGFEFLYRFITETEFVLCLEGSVDDGQVSIENFRLARIDATSVNHVRYQPCAGENYLGTAHNHPPSDRSDLCKRSDIDRRSFSVDQRAAVDIVLCGNGRFAWVLRDGRSGVALLPTDDAANANVLAARR